MPKQGDVHVVRGNNGGWQVRVEGKTRAQSIHNTQSDAAQVGKEIARRNKSELLIHGRNGRNSRPQYVRARTLPGSTTGSSQTPSGWTVGPWRRSRLHSSRPEQAPSGPRRHRELAASWIATRRL